MLKLPRKLLLWGGAAVVVASGSAFMASNSVAPSSAGEGAGAVSGYTVSNISYAVNNNTGNATGVSFRLTSWASSAPANEKPGNVDAYPLNGGGNAQWGQGNSCSPTSSWTTNGVGNAGNGYGTFSCSFAYSAPVQDLFYLAVEANQ